MLNCIHNLVFYTIFSHFAKKCGIQVIGLCIMVDHIHALIIPKSKKQMSEFILLYSSLFARLYNKDKGRTGRLFEKSFGSAIAYLFNNPVEKKLCKQAEEYRWNFLKYASGQYPFSSDTKLNKASPGLRRAIKIVNICINSKGYLGYQILESIFQKLNIDEKAQIADYIITAFSPFDYNATTAYFGTYDKMVMAINANTNNR
ncbi:MAG: transposase [Bacteroidales bacterium]|nr:transposase [Bacteroidales bacterium]